MKKNEVSLKDLLFIAKKIVKKSTIKKINSVEDKKEKIILYDYVIKSTLEFKYVELKEKIDQMEKTGKDVFILKTKLHLLGSKIHFFNATMYKEDFKKIMKSYKEIEKEMKRS